MPDVGPGDVLIEIRAAGICGSDIGFYDGVHEEVCRPPVVLGHEFAGVISRVGPGVKGWEPGDRVVSDNTGYICGTCHACSTANYLLCPEHRGLGYGMDGGFTRFVKINGSLLSRIPNTLFRIPKDIPFEHAAILDPAGQRVPRRGAGGRSPAGRKRRGLRGRRPGVVLDPACADRRGGADPRRRALRGRRDGSTWQPPSAPRAASPRTRKTRSALFEGPRGARAWVLSSMLPGLPPCSASLLE